MRHSNTVGYTPQYRKSLKCIAGQNKTYPELYIYES